MYKPVKDLLKLKAMLISLKAEQFATHPRLLQSQFLMLSTNQRIVITLMLIALATLILLKI
jgi:hypothetical protein